MENFQFVLNPNKKGIITANFCNKSGETEASSEEKRYDLKYSGTYDPNYSNSIMSGNPFYRNCDESSAPLEIPLNSSNEPIHYDLVMSIKYVRSGNVDWQRLKCESKTEISQDKFKFIFRQLGAGPHDLYHHYIRTEIIVELV